MCPNDSVAFVFARKPMEWAPGLSVILMLNGLLVPVPWRCGWRRLGHGQVNSPWTDIAFDSGCLIITISHSQQSEFADETSCGGSQRLSDFPPEYRMAIQAAAKETIKQSSGHRIALVFSVMTRYSDCFRRYLSANGNRRRPGL